VVGVEGWGEKSVVERRLMEGGKVLFELSYVETSRLIFSLAGLENSLVGKFVLSEF